MKIYNIVFSPTGGTEKVAHIICRELGNDVEIVDLSRQDFRGCSVERDGLAVISMPSFGGRAPQIAIERLKKIQANATKAVVVAVYGNREQEDTLIEISDTATECGFKVVAGISAIAEHSIAHQYATGRPDKNDETQLKKFAEMIMSKIDDVSILHLPGNHPYKKAGAGLTPKATSSCTACGICVKKCPVGAIDKSNPKMTNKKMCINCMRCVSVCPQNARKCSTLMVKLVGVALKKACSEPKENKLYID